MLQVARLAPQQLGESRDLVAGFLHGRVNPDGGFQNRAGASDLYYTVFGLDSLIGLQEALPAATGSYADAFTDRELDFVHLACLARTWAALKRVPDQAVVDRLLGRLEAFRSADGGYATSAGAAYGTAYAAFMALGAYQDLGRVMSLWRGARTNPLDRTAFRTLLGELAVEDRARALLEAYKEQAIRTLPALQNASLKGLLRRVVGKVFRVEIKGWCSEFETRDAAGRQAGAQAAR